MSLKIKVETALYRGSIAVKSSIVKRSWLILFRHFDRSRPVVFNQHRAPFEVRDIVVVAKDRSVGAEAELAHTS